MGTNAAIAALGDDLERELVSLTAALQTEMVERIPELRGDASLIALLSESVHSNLSALARIFRYQIEPDAVPTPLGAREYARRLAQHEVSVTALVRAYRLGHRDLIAWALAKWADDDPHSRRVPLDTASELFRISSAYIDSISEQVIAEYTAEREQWLAHRDQARSEILSQLVTEAPVDLERAEQVLGHRFRQTHLGITLWSAEPTAGRPAAGAFETAGALIAHTLDTAAPLLWPQDSGSTWGWFALGTGARASARSRTAHQVDVLTEALREHNRDRPPLRASLGTVSSGIEGFRATHHHALRALQVATVPGGPGELVTSYAEPGVRAAALLVGDLPETRRLVRDALGPLAVDTDRAARLRATLLALIEEKGSLTRASERLHVHKNTVKYRLHQATELRGRPVDEDRWDLELALHGCARLGGAVLRPA